MPTRQDLSPVHLYRYSIKTICYLLFFGNISLIFSIKSCLVGLYDSHQVRSG